MALAQIYRGKAIEDCTPGSFFGTRISQGPEPFSFFVANSNKVSLCKADPPSDAKFTQSKEGNGIPLPLLFSSVKTEEIANELPCEIQNLVYDSDRSRLVTIDALGNVHIQSISSDATSDDTAPQDGASTKKRKISALGDSTVLRPADLSRGSAGWAGISLDPTDSNKLATARHFYKDISLYDNGKISRRIHTIQTPTRIAHSQDGGASPLLVVTEHNQFSVWDPRSPDRSACIARKEPSKEALYALATKGNLIAVGGEERTVFVYDIRKWSIRGRWQHCIKHTMTFVDFSDVDEKLVYVGGIDSELSCGKWEGDKRIHGFHADSRWTGLHKVRGTDTISGLSDNGTVYSVVEPWHMAQRTSTQNAENDDE